MFKKQPSKIAFSRNDMVILVFIAVLSIAGLLSFYFLDQRIFSWLSFNPDFFNEGILLKGLELLGKGWAVVWLLLFGALTTNKHRPVLITLVSLVILAPTLLPLKLLVHRLRPKTVIEMNLHAEGEHDPYRSDSFPSGDTATVFAAATALASFVRRPWILVFFIAGCGVGLLRITDMAHYLSDVCAGAAIGVLCGWLALKVEQKWLALELLPINLLRFVEIAAVIGIPVSMVLFVGHNNLHLFLITYVLPAVCVYVVSRLVRQLKKYARAKPEE